MIDRFEKRTREKEIETAFHSIEAFEKQLTDGGTILVKLLLDIDQKEQKKRFEKLLEKKGDCLAGFSGRPGEKCKIFRSMQP